MERPFFAAVDILVGLTGFICRVGFRGRIFLGAWDRAAILPVVSDSAFNKVVAVTAVALLPSVSVVATAALDEVVLLSVAEVLIVVAPV